MKYWRIILSFFIIATPLFISVHQPIQANDSLFNMSYIFQGGPNTYIQQVDETNNSLDVVLPNYFNITENGELEISWTLRSSFINEMHRRGIKVVPFLANHWNYDAGVNGLQKREQLAEQVAEAIEEYNLDGVNVDIEGLRHNFRDDHTDFVRILRSKIPSHKEVSVAVAGNPNNWQTGWHGFYDYKALSNYADYLMIMAYDESWESPESPIGPVSSISFFEKSILYATNQNVPRNKIVIDMPFYGRMWKLDGPNSDGVVISGKGISSRRIDPLVTQYNGTYHYDVEKQSPYVKFTIPPGKSTLIGPTKLTEGNYVIWYENERSIKTKLRLPMKYQLKGTGSWALMHEVPNTWNYYTRWLNGKFFADVKPNFWAEENILNVSDLGWMNGTSSTTFAPNKSLTRAEGAVILIRALGYENANPKNYIFTDVKNHWGKREIEIARELEIVQGIGNNQFGPNQPLTREQLATILYNIFQFDRTLIESPFPDVSETNWSFEAILATYEQGHLSGFEDGTFRPKDISNRAQMAALMDRMKINFENRQNNIK